MSRLVVIGDAVVDRLVTGTVERLCPDAPVPVVDCDGETARAGGAGLAATLAAGAGHAVVLVAPVVDDDAGGELERLLDAAGVQLCPLPARGTTREKTRVRVDGQSVVRLDRGRLVPIGALPDGLERLLGESDAILVADYGGGATRLGDLRTRLERAAGRRPVVWDPHPRGTPCTAGTTVVTPNEGEARTLTLAPTAVAEGDDSLALAMRAGGALVEAWRPGAAAVTLGARGALLIPGTGSPLLVPAPAVRAVDPCGAGDCFAVTMATALAGGAVLSEAVAEAVAAASRYVVAGPAGAVGAAGPARAAGAVGPAGAVGAVGAARAAGAVGPAGAVGAVGPAGLGSPAAGNEAELRRLSATVDAIELAERVRRAGGTIVVAGGCFDLLHSGHVALLRTARELGDCLVVALNSDGSVRGLKGEGRPVLPDIERAAILTALASVDAVATFDEPTPAEVLRRLRPHLFVKGGDYAGLEVAEQAVLAEWGGQVVTVPYLSGRSTTRIVEEVRRAR